MYSLFCAIGHVNGNVVGMTADHNNWKNTYLPWSTTSGFEEWMNTPEGRAVAAAAGAGASRYVLAGELLWKQFDVFMKRALKHARTQGLPLNFDAADIDT